MNGAHLHLLLNHVPVIGTIFALLLLAYGYWRKSEEVKKAAFGALALVALAAVPAYLTGEPAEGVMKGVPGFAGTLVEPHEEAAGIAFWASIVLGVVALGALVWFRQGKPLKQWVTTTVLVGSLVVSGLMGYTALLGGKIRHSEIRSGATPVTER